MHKDHLPQGGLIPGQVQVSAGHVMQGLLRGGGFPGLHLRQQGIQCGRVGMQDQVIQVGENVIEHARGITDTFRHLAHAEFRQPLFRHQFAHRMNGQRLQFLAAVLVTTCHRSSLSLMPFPHSPCGSGRSTAPPDDLVQDVCSLARITRARSV